MAICMPVHATIHLITLHPPVHHSVRASIRMPVPGIRSKLQPFRNRPDRAKLGKQGLGDIPLALVPGVHLGLPRQLVLGDHEVGGLHADDRLRLHRLPVLDDRLDRGRADPPHVVDDAHQQPQARVAAQRPAHVRVPDDHGQVGHALEHEVAPGEPVRDVETLPVDGAVHAAEDEDPEARRCHDDVRVDGLAWLGLYAGLGDGVDVVRYYFAVTAPQRVVEVAVRADAQSLGPWGVSRGEVRVDGDAWALELSGHRSYEHPPCELGKGEAEGFDGCLEDDILPEVDGVGHPFW